MRRLFHLLFGPWTNQAFERIARDADEAAIRPMAIWYVDLIATRLHRFGTVVADTEEGAIREAIKVFEIVPARQNTIAVTKIPGREVENKSREPLGGHSGAIAGRLPLSLAA
jgi:hypothetical protein